MAEFQREIDEINAACAKLALDQEQKMIDEAIAASLVSHTVYSAMAEAVTKNMPLDAIKRMYPALKNVTLNEYRDARIAYMREQRDLIERRALAKMQK